MFFVYSIQLFFCKMKKEIGIYKNTALSKRFCHTQQSIFITISYQTLQAELKFYNLAKEYTFMKMKKRRSLKTIVTATLVATMLVSNATVLLAADSFPPIGEQAIGSIQPRFFGYRSQDIENWSPETDPYAESLRASVPLQKRNEAFTATQANPYLESKAEVMLMQGDYGNSFFDSYTYNNTFSEHVLNFWQYADYFSPWHGAATSSTPQGVYDPVTSHWKNRGFEFGIVNIPNPAYTNAAHKNGVMSIACIYFDPSFRPEQSINELFKKDANGEFINTKKLIEMAEYFGYDGYFFNCEESPKNPEDRTAFLRELNDSGLYTQYYDVSSTISGKADKLEYQDSVFVNYGWPTYRDYDDEYLAAHPEIDPYKQIFYGVESNQGNLNGQHPSEYNVPLLYKDEHNNPVASVALFTPSDFYQRGLDDAVQSGGYMPAMQTNEYQWMIAERERLYFSGPYSDPTRTGMVEEFPREDVGLKGVGNWVGVADFISERSVINGSNFYTNFNNGHGMQYFVDGKVSNGEEWSNINIQDILPTWQWWIDTEGSKLNVDFDYGSEHKMKNVDGSERLTDYTQVGAYNGGSSLVMYGNLDSKNNLHLYKTDLMVSADSSASVTFKKTSDDDAQMKLGLIFKDAPETVVELAIENSDKQGDWTTSKIDLSQYAGKSIAAMTLIFDGQASNYQMNVGQIIINDGQNHAPETPKDFAIKTLQDNGETELSWTLDSYDTVKQYNVYGVLSNGERVYLNGIYGDNIYVKSLLGEKDFIRFELCAVGIDGTESEPATINYDFKRQISNLKVEEAETVTGLLTQSAHEGILKASWDAPKDKDFDYYYITVKMRHIASDSPDNKVYSQIADKYSPFADVVVPTLEGYQYTLSVATVKNGKAATPISYSGNTKDVYSRPVSEEDFTFEDNKITFVNPQSSDWQFLNIYVDGEKVNTNSNTGLSVNKRGDTGSKLLDSITINPESKQLEYVIQGWWGPITTKLADYSPNSEISFTLTDYSGNESEPVIVKASNDIILAEPDTPIGELIDNNDLLSALPATVQTAQDATELTELTINSASIESLDGLEHFYNLETLNLSGCSRLKVLSKQNISSTNLKEVNLTDCNKLQVLDLNGVGLEKITYSNVNQYSNLAYVDISENKLDLSEGTPESDFIKTVSDFVKNNEDSVIGASLEDEALAAETATEEQGVAEETTMPTAEIDLSQYRPGTMTYINQRPEAHAGTITDETIEKEVAKGQTLNMRDFANQTLKTVRDNDFLALEGAAWLARDYVPSEQNPFNKVIIRITDANEYTSANVIDLGMNNTYTVEYLQPQDNTLALLATKTVKVGDGKAETPTPPVEDDSTGPVDPDNPDNPNPPVDDNNVNTGIATTPGVEIGTWKQNETGWWYEYDDGSYPTDEWQLINDKWYHFDNNGYMQTGWIHIPSGWYYLEPDGSMVTGWKLVNGKWYYMNELGTMQTGWVKVNNIWYYLNTNGDIATGWVMSNDTWYYTNESGAMQTGWVEVNHKWYYLDEKGAMLANTTTPDGFEVDANGAWIQ